MRVQPFDSFKYILSILVQTGYMKPLTQELSPLKDKLHLMFRIFTILVMIVYDLQHIFYIFQVFPDMDLIAESLFTLIVTINVTIKLITLFVNSTRFEDLRDVINGPFFEARNKKDEEFIQENTRLLDLITKLIKNAVLTCIFFWFIAPFINRMENASVVVPGYFPFSQQSFVGFTCATIYNSLVMFWVGYGHMTCNCFIAALYSQACVQLRIIRHNLEHIVDNENCEENGGYGYKDLVNPEIQQRFVHCVERYSKVVWYIKEIQSILSKVILIQFLVSAGVICMVIFKISTLPVLGLDFLYSAIYLSCLLVELFIYCYFGSLLNNESNFVNESMYLSDWVLLSPQFRRQMVIAMIRWGRPVEPKAAGLIPLSLSSFTTVLSHTTKSLAVVPDYETLSYAIQAWTSKIRKTSRLNPFVHSNAPTTTV